MENIIIIGLFATMLILSFVAIIARMTRGNGPWNRKPPVTPEPKPGTVIERGDPDTESPTERKIKSNTCSRVREVVYNWESGQYNEKYVLDCYDPFNRKVTEIIHIEKTNCCRVLFETNELEFIYNLNRVVYESYEA